MLESFGNGLPKMHMIWDIGEHEKKWKSLVKLGRLEDYRMG
jgi:hypothetical protein